MYSDAERAIYSPSLGGEPIGHYDPLAIRRKLVIATKGKFNDLLKRQQGDDELESAVAEEELVAAVRSAFSLPPLTPTGGVADADALDLLDDYLDYLKNSNGAGDSEPNSSQLSESCRS